MLGVAIYLDWISDLVCIPSQNFSHVCRISKVSSAFRWKLKGENCNSFEKRIKIEDSLLDFKMYCKSGSYMCTNYLRGRKRGAWAQELKASLVNNKTLIKKNSTILF